MEQANATSATVAPCALCCSRHAPQIVGDSALAEPVELAEVAQAESSGDESSGDEGSGDEGRARGASPPPSEETPLLGKKETVEVVTGLIKEFHKVFGEHSGTLYTTKALTPFQRLGHGVPIAFRRDKKPFNRVDSDAEFHHRLATVDPLIAGLPLKELGLVLAGGSVSAHLMRVQNKDPHYRDYDDYDFFLVGHNAKSALLTVSKLHEILAAGETTKRPGKPPMVFRTPGCITYVSERLGLKVQVVLRLYRSVAEVVNGFDLGSSAMAWDGAKLHFTRAGLVAANHGANVVQPIARRASFERRLIKYFYRGFDVVLPGLNPQALADAGYNLPYLELNTRERESGSCCGCHCRLECYDLVAVSPAKPAAAGDGPHSMYGPTVPYGDLDSILLRNYREGAKPEGPNAHSLCGFAPYVPGMVYEAIQPEYPSIGSIKQEARFHCGSRVIRPDKLRRYLGEAAAKRYVELHMERVFPLKGTAAREAAIGEILGELAATTIKGLPHLEIPFDLSAANTRGSGLGLTDRQWYGAAYSRGLIDSAAKNTWWTQREREKAFAEGRDYEAKN